MSVIRIDLNKCIGCENCTEVCPMDVFYFDHQAHKSVLAYPENCQSCGQCYLACPADTLIIVDTSYEYAPVPIRALRTFPSAKMKETR